jgi:hypothetical protein
VAETVQSTVSELEALAAWEMRDTLSISTRPSNDETEIDVHDASHAVVLRARYEEPFAVQHEELDDLADRLGNARVGGRRRRCQIEGLTMSLEGMKA